MKKIAAFALCAVALMANGNEHNSHGGDSTNVTSEYDKYFNHLRGALSAVSSVDFNPSHQGWSVGLGAAQAEDVAAGALGIQYGFDDDLAVNVKAYQAEGANNGMSFGIVKGF